METRSKLAMNTFGQLAVLGCSLLCAGCGRNKAEPKAITAVRVRPIERAGAATAARYSATIEPATRVDVAFKVGGYVDSIAKVRAADGTSRLLQEGDPIRRSQELASVRKADYLQRRDEAKASLAQAVATAREAKTDFDRVVYLDSKQAITKSELDKAREKLDTSKAQVDVVKAHLDEAETSLADSTLRSPMDGIVVKRSIEVGTLAGQGTVAFSIADTRSVKVVYGVPGTVLTRIKLGARQTVTTEAYRGQTFEGSITRIAPVADPKSRVFEIEVTLPNVDQRLHPGMVAALNLQDAAAAPLAVAMVPLNAIVRAPQHPGKYAVFIAQDQGGKPVAKAREIELGEFTGNLIPVLSGLAGSERIVISGAAFLTDGEAIEILP